jgi:hypothetical protein
MISQIAVRIAISNLKRDCLSPGQSEDFYQHCTNQSPGKTRYSGSTTHVRLSSTLILSPFRQLWMARPVTAIARLSFPTMACYSSIDDDNEEAVNDA